MAYGDVDNTIMLRTVVSTPAIEERYAAGTITPGHLIKLDANDKYVVHDSAGGDPIILRFALSDDLFGKDISDDFSINDLVRGWIPQRSDKIYSILTTSQTIVISDLLESTGDGTLRKLTTGTPIAQAIESVTTTTSVARIKIIV